MPIWQLAPELAAIYAAEKPSYSPEQVQPMRDELIAVGFQELLTPEDVDRTLNGANDSQSTTLAMVNSVCGCAAGSARPGVTLALQHKVIPDQRATVFAGMEKAAVRRMRERLAPHPPSSPSIALFRGNELAYIMHRSDIEGRTPAEVAGMLVKAFDQFCTANGPALPPEKFAALVSPRICGSTIEPFES